MTVQAIVFHGASAALELVEMPDPDLQLGEALVSVRLATLCGSDLHTYTGARQETVPCVLGHEAVGTVAAISGDLKDVLGQPVQVGDRVVWSVAVSCGQCALCQAGIPQKCLTLKKYGHALFDEERGPAGCLASHVHLWPGTAVVRVPESLPDAIAAPAMCATATVAAAFRRAGKLTPPSQLVVLGAGMLGITACAMAADAGVQTIIACDHQSERLERAMQFGATRGMILPQDFDQLLQDLGDGCNLVLEFTGDPDVTRQGLDLLGVGGTMVLVGAVFPTAAVPIDPETVIRRMLTITGVHNYAPEDLQKAIEFLARTESRYPFAALVEGQYPLEAVMDALDYALEHRPFRVGIVPANPEESRTTES